MRGYARLLANGRFRRLWFGATVSEVGDAASWVALAWTVYELEGTASAVGALLVVYSAPIHRPVIPKGRRPGAASRRGWAPTGTFPSSTR